jgi:N-acetylglucosamine repressor
LNVNFKNGTFFSGKNLTDVQSKNRSTILQIIRLMGCVSRKELAALTGLNASTVTYIIKSLLEIGLVVETGTYASHKTIGVAINYDSRYVIGIQLARKHIACGLFNLDAKELYSEKIEIVSSISVDEAVKIMKELVHKMLKQSGAREKVAAVGIAAPGPLNIAKGRIAFISNFTGWRDIPIKEIIEAEFNIETIIEHDAHAAALAEKWLGIGKESNNLIYIAAGRGVGAGIIINREVYHGSQGIAGEIGHATIDLNGPRCECGNIGCLELYCSSTALINKTRQAVAENRNHSGAESIDVLTFKDIVAMAQAGDPLVVGLVKEAAGYMGVYIVNLINTLNPDMVILGDEMAEFGPIWTETIKEAVFPRLLPDIARYVKIESSSFQGDPFLIGTGAIAIEYLFNKPW